MYEKCRRSGGLGGSAEGVTYTRDREASGAPDSQVRDKLLRLARSGDPEAFMQLMASERPRLESLVYRLVDERAPVADILQEVYISAYRGLPKYRGDALLSTWLYRIAYNASLAYIKRQSRVTESRLDDEAALPDHAGAVAVRLDLAAALAALPPDQRALVLIVDRDGFDYRAAAEVLSIPVGTVSSRLAAARQKLRGALGASGERGSQ